MSDAALVAATWPPVRTWKTGPFTLRDGAGGGKRVEAASAHGDVTEADLDAMDAPLFVVWPKQTRLDAMLGARGYDIVDPTLILSAPIGALAGDTPPPVSGFTVWPPLQVQKEIWAGGGTGPDRLAVMDRVRGAKTSILGRAQDKPSGTAFVAIHDGSAMVHAVEVRPELRRFGSATHMMQHAARWAARDGATRMSVLVTEANAGAIAFYRGLGLTGGRCYHYRVKPKGRP